MQGRKILSFSIPNLFYNTIVLLKLHNELYLIFLQIEFQFIQEYDFR